jgi:hypothetical protein
MQLRVRAGELESERQWAYAWLAHDGVVYVGATTLHPATRTWLHLHHDDPDIGRIAARYPEARQSDLDVLALALSDDVDRQHVRHGAVALLAERGLLSDRHVCDPPLAAPPTPQADELVAVVEERLRA